MDFDINTLRGLATVFCMIAFIGVVLWAYSDHKSKDFEEAANLPFSDDALNNAAGHSSASTPVAAEKNNKEAPHV